VNVASRMESAGIPGKINVSDATHDLLSSRLYSFEPRREVNVKGKGMMGCWVFLCYMLKFNVLDYSNIRGTFTGST